MPSHHESPEGTGKTGAGLAGVLVVRKDVRRVSIRVLPDGTVRITAPPGFDIGPVIDRNKDWIGRQQARFSACAAEHGESEHRMLLHGQPHHLVPGQDCLVDEKAGEVRYTSPGALKKALISWLREDLSGRIARHAARMDVAPGRLSIRMQRTRWASCSSRGTISANLRLMAIPPELREYIVVHELAHLIEPNHSARYWRLVMTYYPGFAEAQQELKKYWVVVERSAIWKQIQDL
ncbi:MAG: M48 family metallopeptidase [Methanomicrobiaceae archaeon]|nr:M48 family metallopeptidase [Methanomicrobiaceae archaeon]